MKETPKKRPVSAGSVAMLADAGKGFVFVLYQQGRHHGADTAGQRRFLGAMLEELDNTAKELNQDASTASAR